jgi:hypothetical protein
MATQGVSGADKRLSPRHEVNGLVYVDLPYQSTFILNLSAMGMGIQAMEILQTGSSLPFAFPLPETDTELKGMARVVWTDPSGRAGLEFTDLPEAERFRLKQWLVKNAN